MSSSLIPNEPGRVIDRGMLDVADVVARVRRIQEVMEKLMIGPREENGKKLDGVHYGIIPGTPKPTLYQPGAELLCATFRIAPVPIVEDLSVGETARYRVTMRGVNQQTGESLGEGVGTCSSDEQKYRWVRPVCDQEWTETPEDHRREKWAKDRQGAFYKVKQIRTSPADIDNTILKMAYKRALISMTRSVLACSDIFAQDLEDLPDEVRDSVTENGEAKAPIATPQRKGTNGATPKTNGGPMLVTNIERSTGTKDGKAWVKHALTFSDGKVASTFHESVAKLAMRSRDESLPVERTLEQKGDYWNVTELRLIERTPGEEG